MIESLFVAASLMAGAVLAVQAGANPQLSKAIGSPLGATVIQLGIGAALLSLIAILAGEFDALAGLGRVPLWHALGGTASAFYVVSTILLWPRLGAVVSVGLFITGQVTASARRPAGICWRSRLARCCRSRAPSTRSCAPTWWRPHR